MAILTNEFGTLEAFTDAGTGSNSVEASGAYALAVHITTTGSCSTKLQQSLDAGTTWADVWDSAANVTSAATYPQSILNPTGLYRAVVTTHGSGTHTIRYRMNTRRGW